MKGIVFNLLEALVQREHGDKTWDSLLDAAQVDGIYTSLGNYDDRDLFKLVAAAASTLQVEPEAILQWFGRSAMPILAEKYPQFFRAHDDTRSFLLTLNHVIHAEVRKLYPGAEVPEFEITSFDEQQITMIYRSRRKLCALAQGFIHGAADHFQQVVTIQQPKCMHRGDDHCVLDLSFQTGNA
jgi:predicted hydrocarbon binding protein